MISVIVPTYREPDYLDICLMALLEGQYNNNEIIVVVDGFVEENQWVIDKYKEQVLFLEFEENRGIQTATNFGVYNSSNEKILVINDDNVVSKDWDIILEEQFSEDVVTTVNQIEPTGPGMFNFPVKDFGQSASEFRYKDFIEYESNVREDRNTLAGEILPFMLSKKNYMIVNGWDTLYDSPFICDWDFFLKLELIGLKFERTYRLHFYHFGGKATKNRDDNIDENKFRIGEQEAYDVFEYKWGFRPQNGINNTKKPNGIIRGIDYE